MSGKGEVTSNTIFDFLFKAVSVEPRYDKPLCLAAGRTVACRECADACPHDAIRVGKGVTIDPVDCSGCGLCVQACPTGALEPKVSYQGGASVKCSQVRGEAQTVHCLGRLQASDLLRLLGGKDEVVLAHGDCAFCPVGTPAVLAAIEEQRREAMSLADVHGREIDIRVERHESFEEPTRAEALSRRELLRGGWRQLQQGAGEMLAPLDPGSDAEAGMPRETARRYRVIAAARPEADQLVPWPLPRIAESCIMCPICTNACTTKALERTFEPDGQGVLKLRPERCTGCAACVEACPVDAVSLEEQVPWGELAAVESLAFRREPGAEQSRSVARR